MHKKKKRTSAIPLLNKQMSNRLTRVQKHVGRLCISIYQGPFQRIAEKFGTPKAVSHVPAIRESMQLHQKAQRHTHSHVLISSKLSLNNTQVSFYTGCH